MFSNPCAKRKVFYTISIVLIAVSIISMIFRGFNLGIDFTSGTTFEFTLPEGYTYSSDLEEDLASIVTGDTQVQSVGSNGVFIRTSELTNEETENVVVALLSYFGNESAAEDAATDVATDVSGNIDIAAVEEESLALEATENATEEALEEETAAALAAIEETEAPEEAETEAPATVLVRSAINIDKVAASTSARLIGDTFKAVLIAIVLILIYISFRFDFKSGVCAIMALAHDVILMFGFYSVFQLTINTSFIAAVLTIIGYSINATIIVFDRIRENVRNMKKASFDEKASAGIKSSYTRTLFSSLTTLFTIGALYVFGVTSIREFALPIIVGIVCGAYSSLFVAPTFWGWWKSVSVKKK
jgi:preprotein translocase SecF subunit